MRTLQAKSEFLAWAALEKGMAPLSLEAYGRDITRYLDWLDQSLGVTEAESIEHEQVEAYLRQLADLGYAPSSQERSAAAIHSFHGFLLRETVTEADPSAHLVLPKKPKSLPQTLSIEQVTELLDQPFPVGARGLRDRAILELLYGCGLRVSELVSLDRSDVLADDGAIRVFGKGSKERLVPLGGTAFSALNVYLTAGRAELHKLGQTEPDETSAVFLNHRGARLTRQAVFGICRRYGEAVGIEALHPHTLRHSFASHLLEGGADLLSIQELLGHASIATTEVYTHIDLTHVRAQYLAAHPRAAVFQSAAAHQIAAAHPRVAVPPQAATHKRAAAQQ